MSPRSTPKTSMAVAVSNSRVWSRSRSGATAPGWRHSAPPRGLGDLLATAAMGDWPSADDIQVALDSWLPAEGTRRTIARNGRHVVFADNRFVPAPTTPSTVTWRFGEQRLTELPTADQVTIANHLRTPRITVHLNTRPADDLRDPTSPSPAPADDLGRSAQTFQVDVEVTRGGQRRRASATGQDIYAVSGPIAAAAVARLLDREPVGALTSGELFDANELLHSLAQRHLSWTTTVHERV